MSGPNRRVVRVKSLTLNRFRAFSGEQPVTLNTDADIVLIAGPNGVGKTSLMDALCLLITGHYYRDREPLLSFREREGSVSARVLLDDKRELDICTTIRRSNRSSEMSWDGQSILGLEPTLRPLHARASFFFQDILKYLFEEENQETRLEAFLTAGHISPADVKKALSQAVHELRSFGDSLSPDPLIKSEEQFENDRTRLAAELQALWNGSLLAVMSEFSANVKLGPRYLVTTGDSRLRKDWKKTIAAMIGDLDDESRHAGGDATPSDQTHSVVLLSDLVGALRTVAERLRTRGAARSGTEQLHSLLQMNLAARFSVDPAALDKMTERLHFLESARESLSKQLSQIDQALDRYALRADSGPSLLETLKGLRTSHKKWSEVQDIDPRYWPPSAVLDWVQVSSEALTSTDPPVDAQMEAWCQHLALLRAQHQESLAIYTSEIEELGNNLQVSRLMLQLMEEDKRTAKLIQSTFARASETSLSGAVLLERLIPREPFGMAPSDAVLQAMLDNAQQWSELEREAVDAQSRRERSKKYQAQRNMIDRLLRILEEELGDERSSLSNLELIAPRSRTAFAVVLDRYCMRSVLPPVKLNAVGRDRTWSIATEDGRTLSSLSSGQKSLLAISSMVALNAALREHLWADVMAFDDFTTSLDLNHVPRLAALLRQMAYGVGNDFDGDSTPFRKQVFLVSHHEDLTNRFLDFLVPPEGRTMRILRFEQWSSKDGPTVRQMEVETSAKASRLDGTIGSALFERLRRLYG